MYSQRTAFGKWSLHRAIPGCHCGGCGRHTGEVAQSHPPAFGVLGGSRWSEQAPPGALHPCKVWLCFRDSLWGEMGKDNKRCWEGEMGLELVCFGPGEVGGIESNLLRSCQIWQYVEWRSVGKSCFILSGISHPLLAGLFWHPEQPIHYLIDCSVSQCRILSHRGDTGYGKHPVSTSQCRGLHGAWFFDLFHSGLCQIHV